MSRRFINHRSPPVTLEPAVGTIAELKLVAATDTDDRSGIYVDDELAFYFYDYASAAAESLPDIVAPTAGVGRWFRNAGTAGPEGDVGPAGPAGPVGDPDIYPQTGKLIAPGALSGTYSATFPEPRALVRPVPGYRFGAKGDYDFTKNFTIGLSVDFDTSQQLTFRIRPLFPLTLNEATEGLSTSGGMAIEGAGTKIVIATASYAFAPGAPGEAIAAVSVGGWDNPTTPGAGATVIRPSIPLGMPTWLRLTSDLVGENWALEYGLEGDEWYAYLARVAYTMTGPYTLALFWYTTDGMSQIQVEYIVDSVELYPAGALAWLTPDILLAARNADFFINGGSIDGWYDSSGNGEDVIPSDGVGTGPRYSYPTASMNDRVAALFDGTGKMETAGSIGVAVTDFTIIMVFRQTGAPVNFEYLFDLGVDDAMVQRDGVLADTWNFVVGADAAGFTMTDGEPHVLAVRRVGTTRTVMLDGLEVVSDTCPGADYGGDTLFIGGSSGAGARFTGEYAVFALWLTGLSDGNMFAVGEQLADASVYDIPYEAGA